MSTDLKSPAPPDSDDVQASPAKPKIDLSLTQVLGGALAAMTAAFLGSRLSVTGTVIGAAVASIIAAVASSLYTASLQTTREKVKTVWQGRVAGSTMPAAVEAVPQWDVPTTTPSPAPRAPGRYQVQWRNVLLGALVTFALAAAVLTGLEVATGQSLSGDEGTTISQVNEKRDSGPQDATPTEASPSATARETAEPTPSEEPSTDPAPTPSAPASVPAPAPSSTPTPTPTTIPSSPEPSFGG